MEETREIWAGIQLRLGSLVALVVVGAGCSGAHRARADQGKPLPAAASAKNSTGATMRPVDPRRHLLADLARPSSPAAQPVLHTYMVPMRDGVTLATDVYTAGSKPEPAIVVRTPYGRSGMAGLASFVTPLGYCIVLQDVRGRYDSRGTFKNFRSEGPDGYDTVEWVAHQPWCNGAVGMFGASYLAITQWAAADESPPHLKCIVPVFAPSDDYEGMSYQGGALRQELAQNWLEGVAASSPWWAAHKSDPPAVAGLTDPPNKWIWHLPLSDPGPIARGGPALVQDWEDILDHPDQSPFWRQSSPDDLYSRVRVPALIVGGWYDIFSQGAIDNFVGMRLHGATPDARNHTCLVMGPYVHGGGPSPRTGDEDFGPSAMYQLPLMSLLWFNHWLKGAHNGVGKWPAVQAYVMNASRWDKLPSWPPAGARSSPFYLSSPDGSRLGALGKQAAGGKQAASTYSYNPADPVPTAGGATLTIPPGIHDQRAVEARPDVLLFTTAPLTRPLHVEGRVRVGLYITASTPDTDFTAKLVDVRPDGYAANVVDGILRARFRHSFSQPKPLTPGKVTHLVVDLGSTDLVFLAGHRIRLEISSSDFPRFSRNLNTGGDNNKGAAFRSTNIRLFHDRSHPSVLELPLAP